ncbi:hypothetical protein BDW22DRAFT_117793 [Trametopsis cervina]|nr:hypothetical protein BDW22DRAFT_117793 [Trametopsis cervina]
MCQGRDHPIPSSGPGPAVTLACLSLPWFMRVRVCVVTTFTIFTPDRYFRPHQPSTRDMSSRRGIAVLYMADHTMRPGGLGMH